MKATVFLVILAVLVCEFAQANDAQPFIGEWLSRDKLYLMQLFPDGKIYFFGRAPGSRFQMTLGADCSKFTKANGVYDNTYTTYAKPFYPKGATALEKLTFASINSSNIETHFYRVPTNQLIDTTTWQSSARDACKGFVDKANKAHDEFSRMDEDPKVIAERHAMEDELTRLQKEAGDFGEKEKFELLKETIGIFLSPTKEDFRGLYLELVEFRRRYFHLLETYRSARSLLTKVNNYAKMYQEQYDIIHEMRANVDEYACLDYDKRYNVYPRSELLLPEYLLHGD